jgi:hypothetical protein
MKLYQVFLALCLSGGGVVARHQSEPGLSPSIPSGKLESLIVGGGPDRENNQAAIESNVRYLDQLLPAKAKRRILYAGGDRNAKNVLCEGETGGEYYRTPSIHKIDGPSSRDAVRQELQKMARGLQSKPGVPALLYFTGHGGGDDQGDYNNNYYCLWNNDTLSVTDLASSLKSFPKTTPVVLVMVECFSGGFGNLLYEDGSPKGAFLDRPVCGFFACLPQRMAAGCTPEINEANYRDFTSYFFAALTGRDRLGAAVTGADYDHDGKVTMDEALAYALIHDDSIDTPVCTSEAFLRRFVKTPEAQCFEKPFPDVRSWASAPQRAALDALSADLHIQQTGDATSEYQQFRRANLRSESTRITHLIRFVRLYRTIVLAHEMETKGDEDLKKKFEGLLKQEHTNPFTDAP